MKTLIMVGAAALFAATSAIAQMPPAPGAPTPLPTPSPTPPAETEATVPGEAVQDAPAQDTTDTATPPAGEGEHDAHVPEKGKKPPKGGPVPRG